MDIRGIVKTQGWQEAKEIFRQAMSEHKINTDRPIDDIGKEYLALEKASGMVEQAIAQVERAGEEQEVKEQSYE